MSIVICVANESAHSDVVQGGVITGAVRRLGGLRVCSDHNAQQPRNLHPIDRSFASASVTQSRNDPAPVQPIFKAFGLLTLVVLALVLPSISLADVPPDPSYEDVVQLVNAINEVNDLLVVSVGSIAFFLGWIAGSSA